MKFVILIMVCTHLVIGDVAAIKCKTDLECAIANDQEDVVKEMISTYPETKDGKIEENSPIHFAIHLNKENMAKIIIESKPEMINFMDQDGNIPLIYAVHANGSESFIKYLIEKGADVNAKNMNQNFETALLSASEKGREGVVKLLIEKGADVNVIDIFQKTALHYAAENGHENIAKLLIAKGVDVNAKTTSGNSPIFYSVINGHEGVTKLLLENGADVDAKDNGRRTPLFVSAMFGHPNIAKLLIASGANVNEKSRLDYRPLHAAAAYGHKDVVAVLLENNADANVHTTENKSPCDMVQRKNVEEIRTLLKC